MDTLIDDRIQMNYFHQLVYSQMEELSEQGIYPKEFYKAFYEDMKRWKRCSP